MEIPSTYNAEAVEGKIYQFWLDRNYFHAEISPLKIPAVIAMPPPNVYGSLHMGHGFNLTLQDILIRFWRMRGLNALWIPGLDHAGLAFQNAVERELHKEGLTRFDLGRDEFLKRCFAWKDEQEKYVIQQLRRLGLSPDWSRLRFTLDPSYQKAVRHQFVKLFEDGLIYKGKRIINWCPSCLTALSDIEVEYEEEDSFLYFIRYPLKGEDGYITVATTRPETMLGDVAVAVHPEDTRYKNLIGKEAILPLVGRVLPIITDEAVDPSFGTGAVKITPAHDPLDYEIGEKNGFSPISVIDEKGIMSEEAGLFQGMTKEEAREKIVQELKEQGLLEKTSPYRHSVGCCYRCHNHVEPLISAQWFVRMKPLAIPALDCVLRGEIEFVPSRWVKVYQDWMENIKDWCISRQIWWGHRIPVWYCKDCGEMFACEEEQVRTCPKCKSSQIYQDPDCLDTWFSSNLWPFAILGWPEETDDLHYFFPTTALTTGYDIIFFWVARMIMASLYFRGTIPFKKVYIHGLIRDGKGRKMSRSLGNVIDPMEKVEQYGTDGFRFAMASAATLGGQDIPMGEERFQRGRNFTNKLWNASRFVLTSLEGYNPQAEPAQTLPHLWISSRLQQVIAEVTCCLEEFNFAEAEHLLEEFFWGEFCDWYIEMSKIELNSKEKRNGAQVVLRDTLEKLLCLLHPSLPFITEQLWQMLPEKESEALIVAPWPQPDPSKINKDAEERMETIKDFIRAVRNLRHEGGIRPGSKIKAMVIAPEKARQALQEGLLYIHFLAHLEKVQFLKEDERPRGTISSLARGMEIFLPLSLEEKEKLLSKLNKELEKVSSDLERIRSRLNSPDFMSKAPPDVLTKQKLNLEDLSFRQEGLRRMIEELED